jgi:hypothetical protein
VNVAADSPLLLCIAIPAVLVAAFLAGAVVGRSSIRTRDVPALFAVLVALSCVASIVFTATKDVWLFYRVADSLELAGAFLVGLASVASARCPRWVGLGVAIPLLAAAVAALLDAAGRTYVFTGQLPGIGLRRFADDLLPSPYYCASPANRVSGILALVVLSATALIARRYSPDRRASNMGLLALALFMASWMSRPDHHEFRCYEGSPGRYVQVSCGFY